MVCYAVNGYALNKVEAPEYFPKSDIGRPVSGGEVYIGEVDTDPTVEANQKQVYIQEEDGDIIAIDQPIDTSAGGVFEYNGSPVIILVDGDYSMTVNNSAGSQVYYTPSNLFSESEGAIIPGAYYYPDYRAADQTIDSGNTVTFASIDTDTGTDKITIYCRNNDPDGETDYNFLTDFTIDERITLEFENGARITPSSGVSVDINGSQVFAPFQQVYAGDGYIISSALKADISPESFGAIGGDNTDDVTAINKASYLLNSNGGGDVSCGPYTYEISSPVTQYIGVNFKGQGPEASSIVALSGFSGSAMIKSVDFDSLTGSNKWLVSDGVPHSFGLYDITIDADSKADRCIEYYGKRFIIDNVILVDSATSGGLYSEGAAAGGQAGPEDLPESQIGPIWTYGCVGYGIEYLGPHDGQFGSVMISGNQVPGTKGMLVGGDGVTTNGLCEIVTAHLYGVDEDGFVCTRSVRAGTIISESVDVNPVTIAASTCQISNLTTFGVKDSGVTSVIITGSQNTISSLKIIDDTDAYGLLVSGNENNITGYIDGSGSTRQGLILDGRGNNIDLQIFEYSGASTGTAFLHNPNDSTLVRDNTLNLNFRDNFLCIDANETNSAGNIIDITGFDNESAITGMFQQSDVITGSIVSGGTRYYSNNYISTSAALDLSTTANQVITVPHRLLYTPNPAKCIPVIYNTTGSTIDVQYLRINSVDETNVYVGFKLSTADTGTAFLNLQTGI
jgi:hypothetical protein